MAKIYNNIQPDSENDLYLMLNEVCMKYIQGFK